MTLTTRPPLSLYVHLPWCESKCPYCDFNSYAVRGSFAEQRYSDALLVDFESSLEWVQSREVQSVFIGGGTPSLFSAQCISNLLDAFRQRLVLSDGVEITLEANPGSAEQEKFAAFKQAGVNRLSLGVQSFTSESLSRLGRAHSAREAIAAVAAARNAGFKNINLDLMFGLPRQTLAMAQYDLKSAIKLKPQHISYYQMTIEPNTLFYVNTPRLPDEGTMEKIEAMGLDLLADHGYQRYEISAYAQPHLRCLHNLNYWRYGDYLGIGAGAHTKVSCPDEGREGSVWRLVKYKNPAAYMAAIDKRDFCASRRLVTAQQLIFEFMLNALRLTEGFSKTLFTMMTGLPFQSVAEKINNLVEQGLLIYEKGQIRTTHLGLNFLNDIQMDFLPSDCHSTTQNVHN